MFAVPMVVDDMAAGRTLFRGARVLRALPSPCYVPPGIMGNVPHLTPGACGLRGDCVGGGGLTGAAHG